MWVEKLYSMLWRSFWLPYNIARHRRVTTHPKCVCVYVRMCVSTFCGRKASHCVWCMCLCVFVCVCVCVCLCVCVCKDTCVHGRALISRFTTYKIACGLCLKWYHLLTPIFSIVIFCIGLVLHVVCCWRASCWVSLVS